MWRHTLDVCIYFGTYGLRRPVAGWLLHLLGKMRVDHYHHKDKGKLCTTYLWSFACHNRRFNFPADNIPPVIIRHRRRACDRIVKYIPVGVPGLYIRWRQPIATDASTMSGEHIKVKQDLRPLEIVTAMQTIRNEIPKLEPNKTEYFFPAGEYKIRYWFEDWAGNKASCSIRVFLIIGKISFFAYFS